MHIDWDAAAVVAHRNGAIDMDRDVNFGTITGKMFVDRVIEHFEDAVVQTAFVWVPNIHPRALSDRFETLEFIDLGGVVFLVFADAGRAFGYWARNGGFVFGLKHRNAVEISTRKDRQKPLRNK